MGRSRVLAADRLDAVDRSGLVDSRREAVFDELAALAARLLDAPFAFVTAVDAEQSFWKAAHGIADGTRANAVGDSFCQYVIEGEQELIVDDAAAHHVTADNPSIESMGVAAWAGYPVMLGDQILGTFCVVDQRTREWTARDRTILRRITDAVNAEIARRVAGGDGDHQLDRHQLEQLHSGLVQATLPTIPGIDLAAWHRPAGGELVLGDFYDVFPLDGERWCVVIGDVCGHGSMAAVLASTVRTELREAARSTDDPAAIMTAANDAVLRKTPDGGRFATACVFVLRPESSALHVTTCSAGHPAPIVRGPGGVMVRIPAPDGPPLGLEPATVYGSQEHALEPGDTMLGFTDGAVECRDADDLLLGDEAFAALLASEDLDDDGVDAQRVITRVASALEAYASTHTDDIALVAIRHRAERSGTLHD